MPEMHLRQPRFACSAGGIFTKNKDSADSDIFIKTNKIRLIFTRHGFWRF